MKKQMRKADQAKIRQRKHIAFRMNFLFFSIFVLFSLLIFRLGYLQIVKGEDYIPCVGKNGRNCCQYKCAKGKNI